MFETDDKSQLLGEIRAHIVNINDKIDELLEDQDKQMQEIKSLLNKESDEIWVSINGLGSKVNDINVDIQKLKGDFYGNGKEGMCSVVSHLKEYIDNQKGGISLIKWLLGFVGIGNLIIIFKVVFKIF